MLCHSEVSADRARQALRLLSEVARLSSSLMSTTRSLTKLHALRRWRAPSRRYPITTSPRHFSLSALPTTAADEPDRGPPIHATSPQPDPDAAHDTRRDRANYRPRLRPPCPRSRPRGEVRDGASAARLAQLCASARARGSASRVDGRPRHGASKIFQQYRCRDARLSEATNPHRCVHRGDRKKRSQGRRKYSVVLWPAATCEVDLTRLQGALRDPLAELDRRGMGHPSVLAPHLPPVTALTAARCSSKRRAALAISIGSWNPMMSLHHHADVPGRR